MSKDKHYYKLELGGERYTHYNGYGGVYGLETIPGVVKIYEERVGIFRNKIVCIGRGDFPIYAEEIDGKMYDIITGLHFKRAERTKETSVRGLGYIGKTECSAGEIGKALERLDDEGIQIYKSKLYRCHKELIEDFDRKRAEQQARVTRIREENQHGDEVIKNFKRKYRRR